MKTPTPREVIVTIDRLGGDGYVPSNDVLLALRPERRIAQRALRRAIDQGYALEHRGPDGRLRVAVASEGWALLDAA